MRAKFPRVLCGQHTEGFPLSDSVDPKSFPIEGEDIADSRILGQGYESRVSEVHGHILVLCHQTLTPLQTRASHWNEDGGGTDEQLQTGLLTPRALFKQMHCFC